jgi:uncharacterized protein (DUF433 family)
LLQRISKREDVCGGDACVSGTRIPVWVLAQLRQWGFTDERILSEYPGLRPADLEAVWAYTARHAAEIEAAIAENQGA